MKKHFKNITFKSIDDSRFLKTFGKKATIQLLEISQLKDRNDIILVDIREYSSYDKSSHLVAGDYLLQNYLIFNQGHINFLANFIQDNVGNEIYIAESEFDDFFQVIKNIY